jgi:hypothetical protein
MVELATSLVLRASATAENCTAIIIGAAALIEAHVTFRPPCCWMVGWDTVQHTVSNLNSHFPQLR